MHLSDVGRTRPERKGRVYPPSWSKRVSKRVPSLRSFQGESRNVGQDGVVSWSSENDNLHEALRLKDETHAGREPFVITTRR